MAATDGKFFLAKSNFTVLIHRAVSQKYCKISYHLSRDKKCGMSSMGHCTFKERWGGGKAGRVNGSKYCCRSIFYVNVFSTLFCMFYISLD